MKCINALYIRMLQCNVRTFLWQITCRFPCFCATWTTDNSVNQFSIYVACAKACNPAEICYLCHIFKCLFCQTKIWTWKGIKRRLKCQSNGNDKKCRFNICTPEFLSWQTEKHLREQTQHFMIFLLQICCVSLKQ